MKPSSLVRLLAAAASAVLTLGVFSLLADYGLPEPAAPVVGGSGAVQPMR